MMHFAAAPALATDLLEQQFGRCGIDVIYQNGLERLAVIKAIGGEALELAWTDFDPEGVRQFGDAHKIILAGGSIGKTFKALGVDFVRDVKLVDRRMLPRWFAPYFDVSKLGTMVLLDAYVGPSRTLYARILEVYSHRVEWPASGSGKNESILEAADMVKSFGLKRVEELMRKSLGVEYVSPESTRAA
jgi:hypothetical protein